MRSKDILMVIFSGLLCTIIGIILVPLMGAIVFSTTNYMAPIWLMLLIEALVMIGMVAFHTWAIQHDRAGITKETLTSIEEFKRQLNEIKSE